MMVAYFKVSGIIPFEQAYEGMKAMTVKTFKKKGDDIVNMNLALIDAAVNACEEVPVPSSLNGVAFVHLKLNYFLMTQVISLRKSLNLQ